MKPDLEYLIRRRQDELRGRPEDWIDRLRDRLRGVDGGLTAVMVLSLAWMFFVLIWASTAQAATSLCRPTFNGFLEFECQLREGKVNAASFCDVMNQQGGSFRWSRNDTSETKNRADLINAVGRKLCGWRR